MTGIASRTIIVLTRMYYWSLFSTYWRYTNKIIIIIIIT